MNDKKQGVITLILKILTTHLHIIKIFAYFLILVAFCVIFGISLGFYSASFSLNHLPTQLYSFRRAPPPPPLPFVVAGTTSNKSRDMDDAELMWRASITPKRKEIFRYFSNQVEINATAKEKVPKIAFMFMVKGRLPLARVWEEFFKGHKGNYTIYVHSDPSYNSSMETGVFRGRRIPSQKVEWGKFSMIEAELRLLANALLDISNQHFVLLSESCIPLFNFSTIYTHLINSNHSYVQSYDYKGATGRGRYKHRLGPTISISQWRKGSQWFELDRDMAIDIISDQGYFMLFKRACRNSSCYADEHYLATWININAGHKNANRSLTYVDWSHGGCHPAGYRRTHVTVGFLEKLRSSKTCQYNGKNTTVCFLFARKFFPDALDRLLRFAPKVMHF